MADRIRVLVVDDEPLARERLRFLLERESDLEIVGECGDGVEARGAIRELKPHLVFLDIQMPELDGFGLLAQLDPGEMPAVIFVTAYDQFALKAFEVHALDYLLKPFDEERLAAALQRAREWLRRQSPAADLTERLAGLLAEVKPPGKSVDRLAVKTGGRILLVPVDQVDWVEAADNYVSLHIGTEAHLLRETMNSLENRLPSGQFVRISRSTIVNLHRVKELQPLFHGEYAVLLKDGTRLTLSRGYREKLDQLLGRENS